MAEKVKEKQSASKNTKEKRPSAPKELLRRGLLDGTEKLRGQLRDAAERGQREEDVNDRAHSEAVRGTRLASDRLGRLRLGKKKGKVQSTDSPSEPAPTTSGEAEQPTMSGGAEPPAPPGKSKPATPTAERVKIKTREAVYDTSVKMYGRESRTAQPASAKPTVKTKEAYVHRQTETRSEIRQTASAPGPRVAERSAPNSTGLSRNTRQTVKTKGEFIRRQAVGQDEIKSDSSLMTASQPSSEQSETPCTADQGKQKFIREREQKVVAQKFEAHKIESNALTPSERHELIETPPATSGQRPPEPVRRTENPTLSKKKIGKDDATGGKFHVKEARSKQPGIRHPARKPIKTAAGQPRQTVKTAERSGKVVQQAASSVRQTGRATVQAQRRALQAAGRAKRSVAAVGRPAAKAAVSALRGAVSAIRAALAPLAAGGGAVVAVVLVLCMVGALIMSPMGVFFSGEDTGGSAMNDTIREINQEYDAKLEELKATATYDELSISGSHAPWPEILAVYAVKTTSDPTGRQEVVTMDDGKKALLKQVFWDMNELSSFTSTVPGEGGGEDTTTLYITVTAKTVDEMADLYGFTASQRQLLAELLSDENRGLLNSALYGTGDSEIVAVALSQVGNTGGQLYWSWYGFSYRVDWCAIFVSWCADQCGYIDAGTMPKFAGCVQGAQWFKDRGRWQDRNHTPSPGDTIFFDWDDPGGFSGPQDGVPDHVGIVENVENGRVYTVEGNSGDKCVQRSYPVGYYEIWGYGCLN